MCSTPIQLKFGTGIRGSKANLNIKFEANLMNSPTVISNFICKTKSNFCHTYRLNCLEEQVENLQVAKLNIREVPFVG